MRESRVLMVLRLGQSLRSAVTLLSDRQHLSSDDNLEDKRVRTLL